MSVLNSCKNNCQLENSRCARDCMTDTTCRDDCIKNDPSNSCFDRCSLKQCVDKCMNTNSNCTDNCINLHGSDKEKTDRRFVKAETKTINNVYIVRRLDDSFMQEHSLDDHGKCGDIDKMRFICDKSMYCDEDSRCQAGDPTELKYYEKKFRMCKDLMDSNCFETVDSRGLFRKSEKDNGGQYLTEKQLNVHLVRPSEDDLDRYEKYKKEKELLAKERHVIGGEEHMTEKVSYGQCGLVKSQQFVCDKDSYCKKTVDKDGNTKNVCVIDKITEEDKKNSTETSLRLCNDIASEENPVDTQCYEKVQSKGVFRIDSKFDELFSESEKLDKDLLTADNKRCNFSQSYANMTASNADEKCGNYKVKADIYGKDGQVISTDIDVAKVCKPGLFCARDQPTENSEELIDICKKMDDGFNDYGKHRMCIDKKDTYCVFKHEDNNDMSFGFKYGCYKKDKDNGDCDKELENTIEVDEGKKCGTMTKNIGEPISKPEESAINKAEELLVVQETAGAESQNSIDITMICKRGLECSTDRICVPINNKPAADNIMRICNNDDDVNCVVEFASLDKEYKKACVRTTLSTSKNKIDAKLAEIEKKHHQAKIEAEEERKQQEEFVKYIPEKCNRDGAETYDSCNISFKAVNNRTDYIKNNNVSVMKITDYNSQIFKTDQKCGVHYDVVGQDKSKFIVVCNEGDMCNSDNKCVKILSDVTKDNFFRMCRDGEDTNCLTTMYNNNSKDAFYLKTTLKKDFVLVNTKEKEYRILNTLSAKTYKTDANKQTTEEIEKSFVKCSSKVTYDNAEIVENDTKCGYFTVFHGTEGTKDVARLCGKESYCNTDGLCKPIEANSLLTDNAFRVCRNSTDTDCMKKMHDSSYLHYSRVCVN